MFVRLFVFLMGLLLCACGESPEVMSVQGTPPQRIISLAPSLTESVFEIGAGDRLVGVTPYCKFPAEAQKIPSVGALVSVDYERIQTLQPDLVIGLPSHQEIAAKLSVLGIPSQLFRTETLGEIEANLLSLGVLLGCSSDAEAAAVGLGAKLDALSTLATERRSTSAAPRVLFVIGRNPGTLEQMYAAGSENFLNEILSLMGAANVFDNTASPWPLVSKEQLISLDPEIIVDSSQYEDGPFGVSTHMSAWSQMPVLSAVRNGRIHRIDEKQLLIPGPGCVDGIQVLLDAIYPPHAPSPVP